MKTYLLDTNVLLADARSLYAFEENEIILPFTVLEELDKIKSRPNEVGANARECVRQLSELIAQNPTGAMRSGVRIRSGGTLRLAAVNDFIFDEEPGVDWDAANKDNHILNVCRGVAKQHKDDNKAPPILVTRDILLRVKCDFLGIPCEDYKNARVVADADGIYSGVKHIDASEENIQDYWECEKNPNKELCLSLDEEVVSSLVPNQFLILHDPNSTSQPIVRYVDKNKSLKVIHPTRNPVYGLTPRNREQHLALDLLLDPEIKLVTLLGTSGGGKAQPLDAKILTPTGWTTMGKLSIGDSIIARNGKQTKITGVFPQGNKEIFKITFSDRSSTECCADHLWHTRTISDRAENRPGTVKSLKDIKSNLTQGTHRVHSIPMVSPVEFIPSPVPLDPYLLGALLGDGGMSQNYITYSTADIELITELSHRLPLNCKISKKSGRKYDYGISDARTKREKYRSKDIAGSIVRTPAGELMTIHSIPDFAKLHNLCYSSLHRLINGKYSQHKGWTLFEKKQVKVDLRNNLVVQLDKLGLMGSMSYDKFIPEIYKYNDMAVRLEVLRGLMDTDGFVRKDGITVIFYSTSEKLSKDVQELVWSLGGKATISNKQTSFTYKSTKKLGRKSYAVHISLPPGIVPFRLTRKLDRFKPRTKYPPARYIESIESIGYKEARCISIEDKEHLYITDDYIVTHNTLLSLAAGLEQVIEKKIYKSLLICRPIVPVGNDLGFMPGDKKEKLDPWMGAIKDNLKQLLFSGRKTRYNEMTFDQFIEDGVIEMEAITYLRGRSIADTFILIDESQNISAHELKTIITRVGENTKIVLNGDSAQVDAMHLDAVSNGLTIAIEKFKPYSITSHITLTKGERSELSEIAVSAL